MDIMAKFIMCYITLILHTHTHTHTHISIYLSLDIYLEGFPDDASNKEPAYQCRRASLVAQLVKNVPATQETQVRSLAWEDPLEKEMETHCSILAWRIPQTEKPGRLQSMGSQESDVT